MLTMNKSGIGNESESAIVDACSLANRLEEQQDKYNTLYTTFKEIKDKEIKFDYCPNAEEKYVDSLVSIRILMNSMKEDLDGLEYLIQQKAEMITGEKLDELEQERYRGYLRDIEAHNEGIKRLENDIKSLPYLKETYNLLEPIPKFQKKLAMDFQVKESNINFIGEYTKVNKKLERARKQWLYSKIHLFIQDVMHDQLEINARSIIRRETAVIIQDMKKIIPTVTSTSTNKKVPVRKSETVDKTIIKNKISTITQEIDEFMPATPSLTLDTERISSSLRKISSTLKNHEQILNVIYDPFKEKKRSDINQMEPMYALQSIDTVKQTACLTDALAATVVKMTENQFSDYNRRIETLSREMDGLDSL